MKNVLKILMITHFTRYRTNARSLPMAKQLVRNGHEVSLISIANEAKSTNRVTTEEGVKIIETPDLFNGKLRSGWDPWDLANRLYYLSHEPTQYDILHCFETRPITIYPADYVRRRQRPLFLTDWNDWWGRGGIIQENRPRWYQILLGGIETYYEEAFRKPADGLTVISTGLQQRAMRMGIAPEKICHIPGGALIDHFKDRSITECRAHTGYPLNEPIIGYSSINAHYELDMMLQILAIVVRRFPMAKLLLTGDLGEKEMMLAGAYGVQGNLYLPGYLPFSELPWYLGCANLFILPFPDKVFNIGRWPNKIGDYLCLGRPLVSNPVGDLKILLENNNVGLLAAWDPADFADKIITLIEQPAQAEQMGYQARQLAVERI